MFEVATLGNLSAAYLSKVVLAIGSLGTAAYGVVDASKAFGGGVSRVGFGDIKKVVAPFFQASTAPTAPSVKSLESVFDTLRANWMNGMAMADQKAIAKALIKLNLSDTTAAKMAAITGVDPAALASVATKLSSPSKESLTDQETDVFGRFDLALAALLDQGYQRGDQRYRNSAKLAAIPASVALALLGAWALDGGKLPHADVLKALVAGLLATPLAPVAKDIASAIQAGAKVAQAWKS
jgi:hypothetical protein